MYHLTTTYLTSQCVRTFHSPMIVPLWQSFKLPLFSQWKQCWCLTGVLLLGLHKVDLHTFSLSPFTKGEPSGCQSLSDRSHSCVFLFCFFDLDIFSLLAQLILLRFAYSLYLFHHRAPLCMFLSLYQTISASQMPLSFQLFEAVNWDLPDRSVLRLNNRFFLNVTKCGPPCTLSFQLKYEAGSRSGLLIF